MNKSNKLGQKRKDRAKIAHAKVLRRRKKIQNTNKVEKELNKIRRDTEPRVSPIRNNYE